MLLSLSPFLFLSLKAMGEKYPWVRIKNILFLKNANHHLSLQ